MKMSFHSHADKTHFEREAQDNSEMAYLTSGFKSNASMFCTMRSKKYTENFEENIYFDIRV